MTESIPDWQRRALRDIADGHLAVWRAADGTDRADRQIIGAPSEWWNVLADAGLLVPPDGAGRWQLARR